jgi:hypothetical protein
MIILRRLQSGAHVQSQGFFVVASSLLSPDSSHVVLTGVGSGTSSLSSDSIQVVGRSVLGSDLPGLPAEVHLQLLALNLPCFFAHFSPSVLFIALPHFSGLLACGLESGLDPKGLECGLETGLDPEGLECCLESGLDPDGLECGLETGLDPDGLDPDGLDP